MKMFNEFCALKVVSLGGLAFAVACGSKTSFNESTTKPSKLEVATAETGTPKSENRGAGNVEGDASKPPVVRPDASQVGNPQTSEIPETGASPVPSVSPSPSASPAPSVISKVDVCAADLAKRFGGFSLKGGTKAAVSPEFEAYPGKVAEFSFPKNSKLSYSSGSLRAAKGVTAEEEVSFVAKIPGVPACVSTLKAKLQPDDAFVSVSAQERGLKGKLYALSEGQSQLPNFAELTPSGDVYISTVDVPNRSFTEGFPGVAASLTEWFAIDFSGQFLVEMAGDYEFKVSSDDGSRLYLNGSQIIDNDGTHSERARVSEKIRLERGAFPIRLSYFQGPRVHIALSLFYKGPGVPEWTIVPQSLLRVGK